MSSLVTIFCPDKTQKKIIVNDTYANVCAAISQIVGTFEGIRVEPVIKKDLSSLTAFLFANRLKKDTQNITFEKKTQRFPEFANFKG